MKKYTPKNWNTLVIACVLGLLYAGFLIFNGQQGITSAGLLAFGFVMLLVAVILLVVNRYFREKG